MVMLPDNTQTTRYKIESQQFKTLPRPYLGMSTLGHECMAKLWFDFRWASYVQYSARTKRIFDRGDLEEARVIADLKAAGLTVFRRDETGEAHEIHGKREEQEEIIGFAGHAKGHPDGRVFGVVEAPKTEHLLEIKTMNDKSFKNFLSKGFDFFYGYFCQMQRYMKALNLKRALFITTNKNDESRDYVRVYYNPTVANELEQKERDIIQREIPFKPPFPNTHYLCKWCNHQEACHFQQAPVKTCRSCKHVNLLEEGKWECNLNKKQLTIEDQEKACHHYRRLF